jgi:hypothetical protein
MSKSGYETNNHTALLNMTHFKLVNAQPPPKKAGFVGLLIVATWRQLLLAKPFATACSIVMPHLPD